MAVASLIVHLCYSRYILLKDILRLELSSTPCTPYYDPYELQRRTCVKGTLYSVLKLSPPRLTVLTSYWQSRRVALLRVDSFSRQHQLQDHLQQSYTTSTARLSRCKTTLPRRFYCRRIQSLTSQEFRHNYHGRCRQYRPLGTQKTVLFLSPLSMAMPFSFLPSTLLILSVGRNSNTS